MKINAQARVGDLAGQLAKTFQASAIANLAALGVTEGDEALVHVSTYDVNIGYGYLVAMKLHIVVTPKGTGKPWEVRLSANEGYGFDLKNHTTAENNAILIESLAKQFTDVAKEAGVFGVRAEK